jgi:hypothetical protein
MTHRKPIHGKICRKSDASNLKLFPVINVKSRPRYISVLKEFVLDISRPTKSRHYFDALKLFTIPPMRFPNSNKLIKLFDLVTFLYVELIESRKIVI